MVLLLDDVLHLLTYYIMYYCGAGICTRSTIIIGEKNHRDKFHVRCTDASAMEALSHLPAVLSGAYRSPSLRDFLCDSVEIHMQKPVPMQMGGDLLRDRRDYMRIDLADNPVRVLGGASSE